MSGWVKVSDSNSGQEGYLNLANVVHAYANGSGSAWRISAITPDGGVTVRDGFASKAEALDALRVLVHGFEV